MASPQSHPPPRPSLLRLHKSFLRILRRCALALRSYSPSFLPWHAASPVVAAPILRARAGVRARMPADAWDSHMHIFDPARFPMPPGSAYEPQTYLTSDALAFEASLGIAHLVLVQPSCYGNDNSSVLEALHALGHRRARAVIMFDPATTTLKDLEALHTLGVRGVRINLKSVGRTLDAAALRTTLQMYADAVRPLRWIIQIYVPLPTVKLLEPIVPLLGEGTRVCIDHMGHPDLAPDSSDAALAYRKTRDPYVLPGFASLVNLLEGGSTYVKMSGAYRFTQTPDDYADIEPMAREILQIAGKNRVVFASDWPHTRFEGLDITPWAEKVLEWCGDDAELANAVFRDTAKEIWGVKDEES